MNQISSFDIRMLLANKSLCEKTRSDFGKFWTRKSISSCFNSYEISSN